MPTTPLMSSGTTAQLTRVTVARSSSGFVEVEVVFAEGLSGQAAPAISTGNSPASRTDERVPITDDLMPLVLPANGVRCGMGTRH
jgi:hypothetical protein